jgi:hypothetical protein
VFLQYFLAVCPGLFAMVEKYVRMLKENNVDAANFNADVSFLFIYLFIFIYLYLFIILFTVVHDIRRRLR